MIPFFVGASLASPGVRYAIPNCDATAADPVAPYNTTVGIRFGADGHMYTRNDISGAEVWDDRGAFVEPDIDVSDHDVRVTSVTGPAWTAAAAADDVWIGLGSNRDYLYNSSTQETISIDFTAEIRDAGDNTVATRAVSLDLENTL